MADAQASGACSRKAVWVQVPSPALENRDPNLSPVGDGFGFLVYLKC